MRMTLKLVQQHRKTYHAELMKKVMCQLIGRNNKGWTASKLNFANEICINPVIKGDLVKSN